MKHVAKTTIQIYSVVKIQTYLLFVDLWSRSLLKELSVEQLIMQFPVYYRTRMLSTLFKRAHN